MSSSRNGDLAHAHPIATPAFAPTTDPVCGVAVDPVASKHRVEHGGQTYHFCSAGCRAKFEAAPSRFLNSRAAPVAAQPGAIYSRYRCWRSRWADT